MPQKFKPWVIPPEDDDLDAGWTIPPEDDEYDKQADDDEDPPYLNIQPEESTAAKIWRGLNTPLVDVSPPMRQAMEGYEKEHPYLGRAGNFLTDATVSGSSALGIGLGGTSVASGLALKYGRPAIAKAFAKPAIAAGAGATIHGGYRTVNALGEGNYPEAFGAALEMGAGAFGLKQARRHYGQIAQAGRIPPVTSPNASLGLGGRIYPTPTGEPIPVKAPRKVRVAATPVEPSVLELRKQRQELIRQFSDKETNPQTMQDLARQIAAIDLKIGKRGTKRPSITKSEKGAIGDIEDGPDTVAENARRKAEDELDQLAEKAKIKGINPNQDPNNIAKALEMADLQDVANGKFPENRPKFLRRLKGEEGAIGPGTSDLVKRNRMRQMLKELDEDKSGDVAYKHVFDDVPGEQPELGAGETWRSRAVNYIRGEKTLPKVEPPKEQQVASLPPVEPKVVPPTERRASDDWQAWMNDLDKAKAPDSMYRDILSTGSKAGLKPGETWRGRVARFIEMDKRGGKTDYTARGLRSKDVLEGDLKPSTLPDTIEPSKIEPKVKKVKKIERYDRRGHITGRFMKKDQPIEADMFERGALEPKEDFTHKSFLDNMRQILKNKLGGEEGEVRLPNVTPYGGASNVTMREAIEDWGNGRNVSHLLQDRVSKATNNSTRDTALLGYLRSVGINTKGKNVRSPSIWHDIGRIDEKAGRMIENYFSRPTRGIREIASVTRGTKNLALTGGVPWRTGQVSAHGFNILRSDIQARGFGKAIKNYGEGSIDPQVKVDYVNQHQTDLKKLVEAGMTWGDIEGQSAMGPIETKIDQVPYLGAANKVRRELWEKPLFQIHLPATKLKIGIEKVAELRAQGKSDKEAYKLAAKWADDFSGSVNTTFRNKTINDVTGIVLLAPHWTESRFRVAKKGLMPIGKGGVKGYGKPAARGLILSAPGVAARLVAAGGLYNYMTQSKAAESTSVPTGEVSFTDSRGRESKKERSIDLSGTAVEPHRMAIQSATQLAKGDLRFPMRYLGNKASMPAQAASRLFLSGIDPYGNPISGKDRFGRPIPGFTAAMNILQEASRPITPTAMQAIVDYYRGKGSLEEVISKALELPTSYTFKERPKKTSSGLGGLK